MAKKKFEQEPYNPLHAELLRDASILCNRQEPERRNSKPERPSRQEPSSTNVIDLSPRSQPFDEHDEQDEQDKEVTSPPSRPAQTRPIQPTVRAPRSKVAEPNGPTKRYKVTVEEDNELGKFVLQLRHASNTKVSLGLLNRVTNTLLMQALPEIIAEVNSAPQLYQPPNNDALAYADFEESWAQIIERALRRRRNPR